MKPIRFHFTLCFLAALFSILAACTGCAGAFTRAQKGGTAHSQIGGLAKVPLTQELRQPENPAAAAVQTARVQEERTITYPAGSRFSEIETTGTNETTRVISVTNVVVETIKRNVETGSTIGAAQKDTAREVGAKLASMRPVQILGCLLILCCLAMFHPAIRVIVASSTLQWVCGGVGLALIFLPVVVVDLAPTIQAVLAIAGIAVPVVWFIAHRHGHLKAAADSAGKNSTA